uniref:Uncharacterized protein n=1 Tax=Engystomops pustulosus TaxID=76066 RepID=A0AAV6YIG5_ENGPU|nr:hypothetical protein GDO81_026285 [Engystomops pustulosus]
MTFPESGRDAVQNVMIVNAMVQIPLVDINTYIHSLTYTRIYIHTHTYTQLYISDGYMGSFVNDRSVCYISQFGEQSVRL